VNDALTSDEKLTERAERYPHALRESESAHQRAVGQSIVDPPADVRSG
jgi:hypothetical protein